MKHGLAWVGEELRYFEEMRTIGKRKPKLQIKIVAGKDKRVWREIQESDIERKPE